MRSCSSREILKILIDDGWYIKGNEVRIYNCYTLPKKERSQSPTRRRI